MGSGFAFGDLLGEDGTGCLIAQRGGAAHADKIPDDSRFKIGASSRRGRLSEERGVSRRLPQGCPGTAPMCRKPPGRVRN